MTTVQSLKPLVVCLISLAAVLPIIISRRRPNLREAWTFIAGVIKLGVILSMVSEVLRGRLLEFTVWNIISGLPIQFRVDGLGLLFALVASTLWIVTSVYSLGYMRGLREHSQTRFFVFFAVAISATMGVAFSANLLTMYLFYELLSLSTYPLVAHHQDGKARTGGRTYLTYLLGTSIGFALPAMIFVYLRSGGNMDFSNGGFLSGKVTGAETAILLPLFVFGFAKAGLMPFHSWLPGAMVAPTPVSALLHAVAVVKVGVFCIIRVFTGVFGLEFLDTIGGEKFVLWLAVFTILTASLIALTQNDLKRRLAFSTISQLGYIVFGISMLSPNGLSGSMLHIGMHAAGKITLFFCAGAIYVASGKRQISEMVGIGRQMPFTMFAFLIGSLSIAGLPPFGGAWSKWYLILATLDRGQVILTAILILSSLLNIAYLLPIIANAYFVPTDPKQGRVGISEAPLACLIPLIFTATACFLLFIYPDLFLHLASLMGGAK